MSFWFFRRDGVGRRKVYTASFPCLTTIVLVLGLTLSAIFHFARAPVAEQLGALAVLALALTLGVFLVVWNRRRKRKGRSQGAGPDGRD